MTDKEFNTQCKRAKRIFQDWADVCGLRRDRLRLHWHRERDEHMPDTVASVNTSWEYRNHAFDFFVPAIANIEDDDELEEAMVHEIAHVLIHPATGDCDGKSNELIAQMEFATQNVTLALIWAREQGRKDK